MAPRIGVFDSGVGGITVLEALRRVCRGAEFVYLGDTANVPYGSRSPEQIRSLSVDAARQLLPRHIDALVVACNTASSWALDAIRATVGADIPVLGVVEPGARSALAARSEADSPILLLATRATVRSGSYRKALRELEAGSESFLIERACPLLVPMIEEGWIDHPILEATLRDCVGNVGQRAGVALLGCTHYPWIAELVQKTLPGWRVVNPAHEVARQTAQALGLAVPDSGAPVEPPGPVEWWFTDLEAVPAFAFDRLSGDGGRESEAEAPA